MGVTSLIFITLLTKIIATSSSATADLSAYGEKGKERNMKDTVTEKDMAFAVEYVEDTLPKMLEVNEIMFTSTICATVDSYAAKNEIDRMDLFARITAMAICVE